MPLEKTEAADVLTRWRVSNSWGIALLVAFFVAFFTALIAAESFRGRGPEFVFEIIFASFVVTFVVIIVVEALANVSKRERNYVKLTQDNFVLGRDRLTVSYAWDRLRNARVEERVMDVDGQPSRAYYFTADVIEPALQDADQDAAATATAVAIPLEGFELPGAEIGKLMVKRTLAARPQPK